MSYSFPLIIGLAPSIIWLLFFLRKDVHPESNKMVLKIFFYGMIAAILAALVEIGLFRTVFAEGKLFESFPLLYFLLYNFIGIAFVEEYFKYLVVKLKVLKSSEFDEPVDAMIYMVIASLGFAALENILVLLPGDSVFVLTEAVKTSAMRMVGAIFLHASASGILGYFIALSASEPKKKLKIRSLGIILATLLHGLYNLSIIKMEENIQFVIILAVIMIGLAFFILSAFRKVKKLPSVSKVL